MHKKMKARYMKHLKAKVLTFKTETRTRSPDSQINERKKENVIYSVTTMFWTL